MLALKTLLLAGCFALTLPLARSLAVSSSAAAHELLIELLQSAPAVAPLQGTAATALFASLLAESGEETDGRTTALSNIHQRAPNPVTPTKFCAVLSISPQLVEGGCTPRP